MAINFSRETSFGRFITLSVMASFGELRYTLDLSSSKTESTERTPCLVWQHKCTVFTECGLVVD